MRFCRGSDGSLYGGTEAMSSESSRLCLTCRGSRRWLHSPSCRCVNGCANELQVQCVLLHRIVHITVEVCVLWWLTRVCRGGGQALWIDRGVIKGILKAKPESTITTALSRLVDLAERPKGWEASLGLA